MRYCLFVAEIDEVLKSTPVVADLDHRSNLLQDKLDGLHERLEREVARVKESLEVMVQDLENTEASLEKRLKVVEARYVGAAALQCVCVCVCVCMCVYACVCVDPRCACCVF